MNLLQSISEQRETVAQFAKDTLDTKPTDAEGRDSGLETVVFNFMGIDMRADPLEALLAMAERPTEFGYLFAGLVLGLRVAQFIIDQPAAGAPSFVIVEADRPD